MSSYDSCETFKKTYFEEHLRTTVSVLFWKGPQSNDKLLWKIMSTSCYMEEETFIEANYANNIHTGKKFFVAATFGDLWVLFASERVNKSSILWYLWVLFTFREKKRQNKCCLWEVNLIFYIYKFSLMCEIVNLFRKIGTEDDVGYIFCPFLWWKQK